MPSDLDAERRIIEAMLIGMNIDISPLAFYSTAHQWMVGVLSLMVGVEVKDRRALLVAKARADAIDVEPDWIRHTVIVSALRDVDATPCDVTIPIADDVVRVVELYNAREMIKQLDRVCLALKLGLATTEQAKRKLRSMGAEPGKEPGKER
jgi:hypothetical protein